MIRDAMDRRTTILALVVLTAGCCHAPCPADIAEPVPATRKGNPTMTAPDLTAKLPPVDAAAPTHVLTATFALG